MRSGGREGIAEGGRTLPRYRGFLSAICSSLAEWIKQTFLSMSDVLSSSSSSHSFTAFFSVLDCSVRPAELVAKWPVSIRLLHDLHSILTVVGI